MRLLKARHSSRTIMAREAMAGRRPAAPLNVEIARERVSDERLFCASVTTDARECPKGNNPAPLPVIPASLCGKKQSGRQ